MSKTRRKNIALFAGLLENEFSISVIEGAKRGAAKVDANLIVFPVGLIDGVYRNKKHNRFRYQYNTLNAFLKSQSIDEAIIEYGTICSALDENKKKEYLSIMGDIPTVLLCESVKGYKSICIDNRIGLEEVINHVIKEHGCKEIGFISGPPYNQDSIERLDVYRCVMQANGLECDDSYVVAGDFSIYSEREVKLLLERHPQLEAIILANDHMALGAIEALKKIGKMPGKDIIVTGFDNIPSSILSEPSLTTVYADPSQLSYNAILALDGRQSFEECSSVPTHMIPRESCGCLLHSRDIKSIADNNAAYIRNATRDKVHEAERRKQFEVELSNINRELLILNDSRDEWFKYVLDIAEKIKIGNTFIFLYDEPVKYKNNTPWIMPRAIDLRGYYKNDDIQVFNNAEWRLKTTQMLREDILFNDEKGEYLVTPLFFRENQYGFMVVESDIDSFQFAYQMANQISTSLEMVNILNAQEKTRKVLEEANQSKSQFLANMSHEIRTPINAILGMNEMILRENKEPKIDEYALNIKNAAGSLLSLVNDILDFSKIEAGKMTIVEANYELAVILRDSINLISMRAKEKQLELELIYDDNLPCELVGDDVRIKQILINLLSNAVKYTHKGKVTLSVTGSVNEGYADISFKVTDTGIGIKQEDIAHLFEKFERIDEKRNRHIEGTGLGMNITLGLLSLMGSTLGVNSIYGRGSEFSFTLHQKVVDATPISGAKDNVTCEVKEEYIQKYTAEDASILVVDDIEMNRVIIASLLGQSMINVTEASSGRQCLELMKENHYDIIFLDHMMPEMDGIETLNEIRKMPCCDYNSLPVIALTANAVNDAAKMYLAAGFNDYISKPVDPNFLDKLITKYMPKEKIVYKK